MTKKAFNPGDWKKPRKKEILRCAQDDSVIFAQDDSVIFAQDDGVIFAQDDGVDFFSLFLGSDL